MMEIHQTIKLLQNIAHTADGNNAELCVSRHEFGISEDSNKLFLNFNFEIKGTYSEILKIREALFRL